MRGVANPLLDDRLGLAQPIGHQVNARQSLVDRRIRAWFRVVEPDQNRLGLGEPADPSQSDGVKALQIVLWDTRAIGPG